MIDRKHTHILIDILSIIDDYKVIGNSENLLVSNVSTIDKADSNSICWINSSRNDIVDLLSQTSARLILCDQNLVISPELAKDKCFIITTQPKLAFCKILEKLFVDNNKPVGIHPSSIIHKDAKIGNNVFIGPFCIIEKAEIGDNSIIHGNCVIGDNVLIGKNVMIHHHTLIGSDGFGFVRNSEKKLEKFHHVGNVVIEDDVEIYPFVNVDKGALAETRIKRGTKIDHYSHIGHNSSIGEDTLITAGTVLCGGSSVGDRTWTGVNSIIKEKIHVGDDVVLGLGSIVTKNVPDGETWLGSPAREISVFMAMQKKLK